MNSRLERHLQRQRGAGPRELKSNFGFTFGIVNSASSGNVSSNVSRPASPPRPQAPPVAAPVETIETEQEPPKKIRKGARSKEVVPAGRTRRDRGKRNKTLDVEPVQIAVREPEDVAVADVPVTDTNNPTMRERTRRNGPADQSLVADPGDEIPATNLAETQAIEEVLPKRRRGRAARKPVCYNEGAEASPVARRPVTAKDPAPEQEENLAAEPHKDVTTGGQEDVVDEPPRMPVKRCGRKPKAQAVIELVLEEAKVPSRSGRPKKPKEPVLEEAIAIAKARKPDVTAIEEQEEPSKAITEVSEVAGVPTAQLEKPKRGRKTKAAAAELLKDAAVDTKISAADPIDAPSPIAKPAAARRRKVPAADNEHSAEPPPISNGMRTQRYDEKPLDTPPKDATTAFEATENGHKRKMKEAVRSGKAAPREPKQDLIELPPRKQTTKRKPLQGKSTNTPSPVKQPKTKITADEGWEKPYWFQASVPSMLLQPKDKRLRFRF